MSLVIFYRVVINNTEYFLVDKPSVDKMIQEIKDFKG